MKKQALSVVYMFLITLFFASLVSAVKLMNDQRIERNQTMKLQQIRLLQDRRTGYLKWLEVAR